MVDQRTGRRCILCAWRSRLRPLEVIAREMRAIPRATACEVSLTNPGSEALWDTFVAADLEQYLIAVARELDGACVYCAHLMPPGRREALAASREVAHA